MKKHALTSAVSVALFGFSLAATADGDFTLLGSYNTGLADIASEASAGETAALRDNRLYVTNALDVSLDIVDVSNPAAPVLIKRVDLSAYGAGVTSVDVSSKNLIAVAVIAPNKTDNGTVVFLDPQGRVKNTVKQRVAGHGDVHVATAEYLLVANEGEPEWLRRRAAPIPKAR